MKINFDDNQGATVSKRLMEYQQLKESQNEYLDVGREVSEWLLPGRGLFNTNTKKKRRTLVPKKVINPKAKQSFETLVAFLKDGICPSSRPWFDRVFVDKQYREIQPLKIWAREVTEELSYQMREANFYSLYTTYLKEICGFGTGAMGVFPGESKALLYQPLTFGEFSMGTSHEGIVDRLYRTHFLNFHKLYGMFGEGLPKTILDKYYSRDSSLDMWYTVVEGVVPEKFMDMPFTRFYILVAEDGTKHDGGVRYQLPKRNKYPDFLKVEGVNEFPYPTTRFDILSGEDYGICPGFESVPVIKRLQEIVKSNNTAYHKSIRPPMNVPIAMKGNVKTYPDAINYYISPEEIIRPAYDARFDHTSAEVSESKLENTLKEIFFNDVFLTTSRDPNASPLKARQVDEISNDKYARLGPTLERFFFEGVQPILNRSLAILDRAGKLPDMPEEFRGMNLKTEMNLTSILAQAIKARAAVPMMEYLQVVGAVGQFNPEAFDIPNTDQFLYEMADIKNIPAYLNNSPEQVAQKRKARAEQMAAEKAKEEGRISQAEQLEVENSQADSLQKRSQASANLSDSVEAEIGGLL